MSSIADLHMTGFGISHVGKVRQRNEDCIHIDAEGRFALLADGMGGHRGGMEASQMTVDALRRALEQSLPSLDHAQPEVVRIFLRTHFQETSRKVHESGSRDPHLAHMGTTLVAWLRIGHRFHLSHVGDSQAHLIRNGQIFQMTMDHTFINEQINLGVSRAQLGEMTMRNAIFRNIGMTPPSEPSHLFGDIAEGDLWLLCSDGLSGKLTKEEVLCACASLGDKTLPEICEHLVTRACDAGGEDNISCILLKAIKR